MQEIAIDKEYFSIKKQKNLNLKRSRDYNKNKETSCYLVRNS